MPPSPFHFARTWRVEISPERFWDTISRTDEYGTWWPWLRHFRADGLREGATWQALIQSPLPYALRVELALEEVVPCQRLVAAVAGDLEGLAALDLAPAAVPTPAPAVAASVIDIEWDMRPRSRAMQVAAVVARPLLRWSHEWVLARGLEQFQARALRTALDDGEGNGRDQ
ncbi:MAG: hypothetical protein JO265_05535 [Acidimicrobiia bacterium]|nr:hypothetical protein [Acidimicrobiia bacterium]